MVQGEAILEAIVPTNSISNTSSNTTDRTTSTITTDLSTSAARASFDGGNTDFVVSAGGGESLSKEVSLQRELETEARVQEAFNTVKFFEETHCLNLQVMVYQ